ncbi:NACHT domain-containing protein [Allopontixanthobacter sediminis]|uniref:NACHT domain-containing protein n=1 Tax=Allopontixanthobacter sediminis TaxID=1689985 RepID=A0A845BBN3_9SPHN|nr:hypothetical protein [Allopontixanthobacter sediminis]MXP44979.1 hypothetical protein [Allopontixanthobacter sediminis]
MTYSPEIDFGRIRPHGGSRNDGFEELCAQLAGLEEREESDIFVRTGKGADAGVECFRIRNDETERGWQAKYVFEWDDSLTSQLNKSIEAALKKHPKLTEYVVCLPFNLPDARQKNRKSQREKWITWKAKWEGNAKKDGRSLEIELWDATALTTRLNVDRPELSGRRYYWFNETELTPEWFKGVFDRARADLGSRYTPETNIELPIRAAFSGCAREPRLNKVLQRWAVDIADDVSGVQFSLSGLSEEEKVEDEVLTFQTRLERLIESLSSGPFELAEKFPIEDGKARAAEARTATLDLLYWVYQKRDNAEEGERAKPDLDYARIKLGSLADGIARIADALEGDEWRLANADAVLLSGDAGTGKSHLLADVVEHQVHNALPAILVLGSYMVDGDPWQQILRVLDLPAHVRATDLLGALDAAAEAHGSRVLVCVDAINERNGTSVWPQRLGSFLKLAESFPRVVPVLSCRTTYLARIVPQHVAENQLSQIEHLGFADQGGKAAKLYLVKRGIVRPGAPNLVPEMHVPLFLKSVCDALDRRGESEIPRGLRGTSALFQFYNTAIIEAVTEKLDLDPRLGQVQAAISSFAQLLADQGEGYATYAEASALFEQILPSYGSVGRGLLPQFESEGLLTVEEFHDGEQGSRTDVRFTFERYSDHIIAREILKTHLDQSDIEKSFDEGSALGDILFGDERHRKAGIVEAIAIQMPEICGREILDVGREINWVVLRAFEASLLWRDQSHFTAQTMKFARHHLDSDELYALLVSIATEPKNPFNARHLHEQLAPLSLPDRDQDWSAWLMHQSEQGEPVMVLIDWALRNGQEYIGEERAELASICLTWLLTTSNREVRDKATKALTALLSNRLQLAQKLLSLFANVNDLYVQERLLAGIYGAVLQGRNQTEVTSLAKSVYQLIFALGSPPLNELLRDHARCILRYADHLGLLPSEIVPSDFAPPHSSPWPIEHVSDELIEGYKQDYDGAYLRDDIVSSCVSDGDFARYEIDSFVAHFGVATPGASETLSPSELAHEWIEEFILSAEEPQIDAFNMVWEAAEKLEGKPGYGDSPEHRELKEANAAFRDTLTDEEWGEYRTRAKRHVEHGLFSKDRWHGRHAARFNNGWARRWVCKRAHDLGWTSERFAQLEPRSGYDRHDHQIERIGKKYQWLAFHELAARMADNLQFFGSSYGDEPTPYTGVIDLRLRDMDPSLLATETYYDSWKEWPKNWWVPVEPKLHAAAPVERVEWLRSKRDILNSVSLVALENPRTGQQWFPLELHAGWRQSGFEDGHRGMLRETWFRTNCYLVSQSDEEALLETLKGRMLIGQHDLPNFEFDTEFHLGEYCWHPAVRARDEWSEIDSWHKLPVPIRPIAFDLLRERSRHDYSIDKTINLMMPTPYLVEKMGLQLRGGHVPDFVDPDGNTVIFDPSVTQPGHEASLVEKTAFCDMLDRESLTAVWVIAGEKAVYGTAHSSSGYGGRLDHTGIYRLDDRAIVQHHLQVDPKPPAKEQLLQLLKIEDLPPGLEDWVTQNQD